MNDFVDDPTIPDTESLYRRIHPQQWKYDKVKGTMRPSSAAFKDKFHRLSVDIASLTTPEQSLERAPQENVNYALASVTAGNARELDQKVIREPVENNDAHAVIVGKQTASFSKKMAQLAKWVIPPTERASSHQET